MKRTHQTNDPAGRFAPASQNDPVYGFGRRTMPMRDVLVRLSKTKVSSERTSSIAFAQFMLPSSGFDWLLEHLILFCNRDGDLDPADIARYLEYPVCAWDDRTGRAIDPKRPSMNDAMCLARGFRAAGEGKWTEAFKTRYETVREWLARAKPGRRSLRPAKLASWIRFLDEAGAIRPGFDRDGFLDVPYQLLHRAASACRGVIRGSFVRPAVFYVVFRDADASPEEAAATRAFEESLLGPWTDWVDTETLEFDLVRVPVLRRPPPMGGAAAARLFLRMADGDLPYEFNWDAVELRRLADVRSAGRA